MAKYENAVEKKQLKYCMTKRIWSFPNKTAISIGNRLGPSKIKDKFQEFFSVFSKIVRVAEQQG